MANSVYQPGEFLIVPNKHIVLKLRGAAINVYLALLGYADSTGRCFPSYNTLADVTGYNKRVCMRAVDELEATGLLKKASRKLPIRGNTSNIYQLQVIHTPSDVQVTGGSDVQVTPSSDVQVTPKLYPLNSNQLNSKEREEKAFKKRYYEACEQDRALARREVHRAAPSNKGTFGSIGDILGKTFDVPTGV